MEHGQRIDRVDFCAGQARRRGGLKIQPPMGRAIGRGQLGDLVLHEARMDAMRHEVGMLQQGLEKADVGRHALDPELAQGAIGLGDHIGEIGRT